MKEAAFVKQNLQTWEEFEKVMKDAAKADPDRLADLFVRVTNDLAFSRTQYPQSQTTVYLNNLASKIHHAIYRNKKEKTSRFITFWTRELPLIHLDARRQFFYAFIFFAVPALIGAVSAHYDQTFARLILGDNYVNTTLENIERGEPMGIYSHMDQLTMFLIILVNNFKVMLKTFAFGLLLSVGTVYILFYNGIMVGVFQYFFYQKGLFWISFLTIWTHGTLEISAIVVAGAAGLMVGNSILFPGTYSRFDSFKIGVKKGLKISIGLIPVIILAAFLEGFVTRLTYFHWSFKASIIIASAIFVIYYYIIYPLRLRKNATK